MLFKGTLPTKLVTKKQEKRIIKRNFEVLVFNIELKKVNVEDFKLSKRVEEIKKLKKINEKKIKVIITLSNIISI